MIFRGIIVFFFSCLGIQVVFSQEITTVSADSLASSWRDNQLAAELKYTKKPLHITGSVDRVSSAGDRYYVALDAAGTFLGIQVFLNPDSLSDAAELQKGQRVTMYCENFADNITFECQNGSVVK